MVCVDCNDNNPNVNPGETEVTCDGLDNDCDPATLDGPDDDGDGYDVCLDCDDTDAAVNPGEVEVECDGVDNDCDPGTEDDPDGDGDGWGVCSGDCDDGDAAVNPGETEVCNDWIDNDCDGTDNGCALSGTISLANADAKLTSGTSGQRAGWDVAIDGDCDGDGLSDILVGAFANNGSAYIFTTMPVGAVSLATADSTMAGAGQHLAFGEMSGDSLDDVLIAWDPWQARVSVFFSPLPAKLTNPMAGATFITIPSMLGSGVPDVDGLGDVDGDGQDDILVGSPTVYVDDYYSGAAFLLLGTVSGNLQPGSADATMNGSGYGLWAGDPVADAGDLYGDGHPDMLIGAYSKSSGKVYVIDSPVSGTMALSNADAILEGEALHDDAGFSLDGGEDVDGDTVPDILVGAPENDFWVNNSGSAYLVTSAPTGTFNLATADARLYDVTTGAKAGRAVALPGDVNGDGYGDILVCAPGGGGDGAIYLVYGPVSGSYDLTTADAIFAAETTGDLERCSLGGGGDVNGDGFMDFIVGAPDAGVGGAAYLILGQGL